jgi:HD-like signal output (HDOD) protein/GGDEF domain-containing protein
VLKVVNSSLFSPSRPVCDLTQALALLGARPLKMLVLGFSLPKELFTGLSPAVLARYWRHTLIKAVAARELADQVFGDEQIHRAYDDERVHRAFGDERVHRAFGDEALTAGLVQDIGLLALIQQIGEPYLRLVDHCQSHGGNLLERELETLGFDHALLSSRLLQEWGLPDSLCAAVAVPHDGECILQLPTDARTLPQVLHLAELLARLVEQPLGQALHELIEAGEAYCGLTLERLRPLVAGLQDKVADLADVLALELPAGERYTDLLVAAQGRLPDLTEAAAAEVAARSPEEELLELTSDLHREMRAFTRSSRAAADRKAIGEGRRGPDEPFDLPRGYSSDSRASLVSAASAPAVVAPVVAEPGLAGRVAAAIKRCRLARGPLSLALVAVDQFSDLPLHLGPGGTTDLLHALRIDMAAWAGQRGGVTQTGEAQFALMWENTPRSEAVETVHSVLAQVKTWRPPAALGKDLGISLSAGVATLALPPKNFPPQQLIDAAQRCLSGVQLSGGNAVKSIEF